MKKLILCIACIAAAFNLSKAQAPAFPSEITVALDGSGNYTSIQQAINSVRDLGPKQVIIHIKKGIYHEKVIVPKWKIKISLVGEDKENTIITNNDYSGKATPGGKDLYGRDKFTTYTTYTVLVQGSDFTAENLTIENTAGRVGQAVALDVEADRCTIKNCKILGNQDTLYAAGENCREYFKDCYIEGTTDFIFGDATAVFQNCTIKSLMNSYVTAASTQVGQQFGYVLIGCKLIPADTSINRVFLGRPWRSFAHTVYIKCDLGSHIVPEGWNPWKGDSMFPDKDKTAYYAEYKNFGPGANTVQRVAWAHQLTDAEASEYTLANIFAGKPYWNPEK